jgi:hypothetical protein
LRRCRDPENINEENGMNKLMRTVLTVAVACLLAAPAAAEKETYPDVTTAILEAPCAFEYVAYDWDFAVSDQGFTTAACGEENLPVWEWGQETIIPDAPANVWATVLNGNYPNFAGHSLIAPVFVVTPDAHLMEVWQYVHIETNWDGGNVKANGEIIFPIAGYTHTMNSAARCVGGQPGWSGLGFSGPSQVWLQQCFDLTEFMGQEIELQFDFGSDGSVMYPGWYLGYVKVGTNEVIATDGQSWSEIKGIFR